MTGRVPLLRRQVSRDSVSVVTSALIVAACVALVLVLSGLQQGMSNQATLYLDRQPSIIVAQSDSTNFLAQASVLPDRLGPVIEEVSGVRDATPIMQQFAMLGLHDRSVPSVLVGYEPGRLGGPWEIAEGRRPRATGEVTLDQSFARKHDVDVGDRIAFRGDQLQVVGLTGDTASFMLPISFTTRTTAQQLARRPETTGFFLVRALPGVSTAQLVKRLRSEVPGVAILERRSVAAADRELLITAFRAPISAMIVISFAIALLVIAVTTHETVAARRREFATLKAIGMPNRALVRNVLSIGLTVGILGLGIGVGLGYFGGWLVSQVAPQYLVSISGRSITQVGVSTPIVGALACLQPLRNMLRIDPASAFRS